MSRRALIWAGCAALIAVLAVMRLADADTRYTLGITVLLVILFGWLTVAWFRGAFALVLLELTVAGAGGGWTVLPGSLSGRILLDGILIGGAIGALLGARRRTGVWGLGRWAPHATLIGLTVPMVWMTIGIVNGHRLSDVVGDGNGVFAFLLTLPMLVVIRDGGGRWLRHWLLVCCAINALATGFLIVISVPGFVPVWPTLNQLLLGDLGMGGAVGYMPNGAYRLYLGSGIYLQVGLALATWELLHAKRYRLGCWALYALLWADVIATYTRGFWIGSLYAVGVVLVFGATAVRRPLEVILKSIVAFLGASAIGLSIGFSLPQYFLGRLISSIDIPVPFGPTRGPAPVGPPPVLTHVSLPPIDASAAFVIAAWMLVVALVTLALVRRAARKTVARSTGLMLALGVALLLASAAVHPPPAVASDPTPEASPAASPGVNPTPSPAPPLSEDVSNQIRSEQFRILMNQAVQSPILGHGFGAIAEDYPYGNTYSYELAYLDLFFKTGLLGLVLFLSYPLRLVLEALRARLAGRSRLPAGVSREAATLVLAIVPSVLLTGATNPYILAAFGLAPILTAVAWLETAQLPVLGEDSAMLTSARE